MTRERVVAAVLSAFKARLDEIDPDVRPSVAPSLTSRVGEFVFDDLDLVEVELFLEDSLDSETEISVLSFRDEDEVNAMTLSEVVDVVCRLFSVS